MTKRSDPYDVDIPHGGALVPVVTYIGKIVYLLVAIALLIAAVAAILSGLVKVWNAFLAGESVVSTLLNTIGLSVLSLAVIDVSKYLLEEEVFRHRELRVTAEARGALTKFLTIITIAVSLEALVFIFQAGADAKLELLVYPALLLICAVMIYVGLGLYQWLSALTERQTAGKED